MIKTINAIVDDNFSDNDLLYNRGKEVKFDTNDVLFVTEIRSVSSYYGNKAVYYRSVYFKYNHRIVIYHTNKKMLLIDKFEGNPYESDNTKTN